MKNIKLLRKSIALFLSVAILVSTILAAPVIAKAVDLPSTLESTLVDFWADPENTITQSDVNAFNSGNKTTMNGAVAIHKRSTSSTNYYLFLPSNADCTNLKIWFNATTASIRANGEENATILTSGEPTDAFSGINDGGSALQYTLTLDTVNYTLTAIKSGEVGAIYVDTTSGSMSSVNASKSNYESGTVLVIDADGNVNYDGEMEKIQGRGNGTWDQASKDGKYPYNLKLGVSTSLLGMNKAKKWCLLANSNDPTLIKNQLTYDFADYIGIKYQPHCKPVDLYVNQQYLGSYQLAEKVEIKSNRINVTDTYENLEIANGTVDESTGLVTPLDLASVNVSTDVYQSSGSKATGLTSTLCQTVGNRKYSTGYNTSSSIIIGSSKDTALASPSDYTGGYLYELEISQRWIEENAGFCAYNRQGWVIKSCDFVTKDMANYSYDLLYALGGAVYNGGIVPSVAVKTSCPDSITMIGGAKFITNPAPSEKYQGKKWSDILDADSAVKYYWTQEYFKNMDSSTSSTYFYKDSDSIDDKLYAGPMWDMDNSIGFNCLGASRWGCSWGAPEGWYSKVARIYRWRATDSTTTYSKDTESPLNFYAALATNCPDFWVMAGTYWYNLIEPAVDVLLGKKVDPNGVLHSTDYYVNTVSKSSTMNNIRLNLNNSVAYDYQSFVSDVNSWFTTRNAWIDSQIAKVDISSCTFSSIDSQTCNGNEIEPALSLSYNGYTLKEGVDYTAKYSNNVNASSSANVVVTGIGMYQGTASKNFSITKGTLSNGKATISDNAYAGNTLEVSVVNASGNEISQFLNYQWKANGVIIDGATNSTYTIDNQYKGAVITVSVKGDGTNIYATEITSNACQVSNSDKPVGYKKTIAGWNYDFSADSLSLANADETGATYYYNATSGENADISKLTASVNASTNSKIKWSGSADLYANDSGTVNPDQSPVMGTSKADGVAWGEFPYFETVTSTKGYENLTFSAKLGGTKKGPRDWKLQYSFDGVNYTDVSNATYSISSNKSMELAFDNVSLPAQCENQSTVYVRVVACVDAAINGINAIIGSTSGDASINNILICGSSTAVVTSLSAPEIATSSINSDGLKIYDNDLLTITDTNGGADVYFTINDGEPTLYENAFNPFDSANSKVGDVAIIKAWANFTDINSTITEITLEYLGTNINQFVFDDYSKNVSNGAVFSNGGIYGESAKMTAYTDGKSQYVPIWNSSNGAFYIAPDDGALWSATSGFYFEVSSAGFNDISFTCQGYTTSQGPNSVSLQYSFDGLAWNNVVTNQKLPCNSKLEQLFLNTKFPDECSNKAKIYIRLITNENLTSGNDINPQVALHNNNSKGNLYINNVVISGEDNGEIKMPYTNKTTNYFGSGEICYYSPSGIDMQYAITNESNKVIASGAYPVDGIVLSAIDGFNAGKAGDYTVSVWAGDDDDRSLANIRHYYYKGETVTKFNYNDTKKLLETYLDESGTVASNTSGTNSGTLAMYPTASEPVSLGYTNGYGVKVSKPVDAPFSATKKLDNPNGNGYWLITASTKGYTNLVFNAEQISSNKAPRDWGLAYSLDGENFTYLAKSNVHTISNDSSDSPVETYNNYALPSECDDKDVIYIKVFINGGESVNGKELETADTGNTGINGVEICGVAIPKPTELVVNTVAYGAENDEPVPAIVTINGKTYETENATVNVQMQVGDEYVITASSNGNTFVNTISGVCGETNIINVPVVDIDMNSDGIINAKDYAMIRKSGNQPKQARFKKLVNAKEENFNY